MKKLLAVLFLLPLLFVSIKGQATKKVSFLASSCAPDQTFCNTKELYRFNFENGELVSKEILCSTDEDLDFDGRTDRIYQNRYLVSHGGEIFDLLEKKLILKDAGDLHRIEGDKIYFKLNHKDKDGLYVYDLLERKYTQVQKIDVRMLFAQLSPDGTKSLEWRCPIDEPCRIEMREFEKGVTRVFNGSFSVQRGPQSCDMAKVPVFWVDNERFLTQESNGEIFIGNINGKIKKLLKFKINQLPYVNPKFFRDKNGRIIYRCVLDFVIDIDKKTVAVYNPLGEGFSEYKDEFFLQGKSIGAFDSGYAISTKDYLIAEYSEKGEIYHNTPGVKVWSTSKQAWTTLEISWSTELIGFIE